MSTRADEEAGAAGEGGSGVGEREGGNDWVFFFLNIFYSKGDFGHLKKKKALVKYSSDSITCIVVVGDN